MGNPSGSEARNCPGVTAVPGEQRAGIATLRNQTLSMDQRGPEMPCFRIIRKCMSMNTASNQGITKVWRL